MRDDLTIFHEDIFESICIELQLYDNNKILLLLYVFVSSSMATVCQQVDHPVEKWSDINHAKKSLGTRLYKLQKEKTP